MGAGHFLRHRQLRGAALLDLFSRPAPGDEPLLLRGFGTSEADDGIEFSFDLCFKQQRDDHHRHRAPFSAPGQKLLPPEMGDAGMGDGFKFCARGWVGKNNLGQPLAAQLPGSIAQPSTERLTDFFERRLTWLHHLPGEVIGINDRKATRLQKPRRRGFAHADAAGQAKGSHAKRSRSPGRGTAA